MLNFFFYFNRKSFEKQYPVPYILFEKAKIYLKKVFLI